MKRIFLFFIVAVMMALVSCEKKTSDAGGDVPGPGPEQPEKPVEPEQPVYGVTVSVSVAGFMADEQEEAPYGHRFVSGDACGLYVVKGEELIVSNAKFEAEVSGEDIRWVPAEGSIDIAYDEDNAYFLYYPYSEDSYMDGKAAGRSADDAEAFFSGLVSSWMPAEDQSSAEKFASSDLMVAKAVPEEAADDVLPLPFVLEHQMALAVFGSPSVVYDFEEDFLPDYSVCYEPEFSSAKPLALDGDYLYLVRPGAVQTEIEGSIGADGTFCVTVTGMSASTWQRYGAESRKPCVLAAGDFYCRAADGTGYVIPQEAYMTMDNETPVVGIVFHVGKHAKDTKSDYSLPLTSGGARLPDGLVHGYAVALTDVNNGPAPDGEESNPYYQDMLLWSARQIKDASGNETALGTSTDKKDWNGYYNCQQVHRFIDGHTSYSIYDVPVFQAAENYGNRTVDVDGSETDRYVWQKRFAAPSDCSGWFLPSAGQLSYLYEIREQMLSQIEKVKGIVTDDSAKHIRWVSSRTWYEWSSTEYQYAPHSEAYAVYFNNGKDRAWSKCTTHKDFARSVLVF